MNGLLGPQVRDPNYKLRFCLIVLVGLLAFGSLLLWKGQMLFAAEYQEMPITHSEVKIKKENRSIQEKMKKKLTQDYELEN